MKTTSKNLQKKLDAFIHRLNVENVLLMNAGSSADSLLKIINKRIDARRERKGRHAPTRVEMLAKIA